MVWVLLLMVTNTLVCCKDKLKDFTPHKPSLMYKCVPEEGCQSSNQSHKDASFNTYSELFLVFESLNLCLTVCGHFGGLWPKPTSATLSTQTVLMHPNYLRYTLNKVPEEARELMTEITKVVSDNIKAECGGEVTAVVTTPVEVYLTVRSSDLTLTWDTDEGYTLEVQEDDGRVIVHITGQTVYGVRHGLESFTQLISSDRSDYSDKSECGLRLIAKAKISDRPAYKHRGFLLDTSRHFIPMENIKRTIDGLAATKMNVFHWHVTDSHSFPLESSRVPQFTKYGAYSPSEIYSVQEVMDLVKYAQVRGVRVVIEIDAPAHAGYGWQWGNDYGYGDLAVCVDEDSWWKWYTQPPCGQLNPANQATYRVLRNLYRDVAELLPKPQLFHMGGDEVTFDCWESNKEIKSYMTNKGFTHDQEGFLSLWAEFHANALQIWDEVLMGTGSAANQSVMIWSSELTDPEYIQKYLNKDRIVIEVWDEVTGDLMNQLLNLGYRVVHAPRDVWYLDLGFFGSTQYSDWERMYEYELPRDPGVLGGEVAMWTEYVDAQALDMRVWPRAAAVGEALWTTAATPREARSAKARLQRLCTRLIARGLRPSLLDAKPVLTIASRFTDNFPFLFVYLFIFFSIILVIVVIQIGVLKI